MDECSLKDIAKACLGAIIVLIILYILISVLFGFKDEFVGNQNLTGQPFYEYMQSLTRRRVFLYRLLVYSFYGNILKCTDLPKPSKKKIIEKLYDNSREIANSYIPFFGTEEIQVYGSGIKETADYNVFRFKWPTPYAPYQINKPGYLMDILDDSITGNGVGITNKKLMPYFHTQLNQFLQKEVNIMASSIAYFKNNNVADLSLFTMLDNNAKQLINLYSTYTNVNTDDLYNSFINLYKLILNSCNYAKLVSLNCSYNKPNHFDYGDEWTKAIPSKCSIMNKQQSKLCKEAIDKDQSAYSDIILEAINLSNIMSNKRFITSYRS